MTIFKDALNLTKRIFKSVGNNLENDEEDVRTIRESFDAIDFNSNSKPEIEEDGKPLGMITRALDTQIKDFQKENDLKVDGVINPGGETEQTLLQKIAEKKKEQTAPPNNQKTKPKSHPFNLERIRETIKKDKDVKSTLIPKQKPEREKEDISNLTSEELIKISKESSGDRKKAILENKPIGFTIEENFQADGKKPFYRIKAFEEVTKNESIIIKNAEKSKVDPDLIKAVIYLETTQGWYDRLKSDTSKKSIRPMNIHVKHWENLGYNRKDLMNPEKNIEAGTILLKRISDNVSNNDVEKIGSLYNSLGSKNISNYGAQLKKIYEEKPWIKK